MRITVLDDDPGRKINLRVERYVAFIDGVEVERVLTADDEKGEVVSIALDSLGKPIIEDGKVKRQTLYGKVTIERIKNKDNRKETMFFLIYLLLGVLFSFVAFTSFLLIRDGV